MFQRALRGEVSSIGGAAQARQKLRMWLILFALALAVPIGILTAALYERLQVEARNQLEKGAEDFIYEADARLASLLKQEEDRAFEDYSFISLTGNHLLRTQNSLNYSPLSYLNSKDAFPGAIGYFQINPNGTWQTPLLPELGSKIVDFGAEELSQRKQVREQIEKLLKQNGFLKSGDYAQRRLSKSSGGKKTQVTIVPQQLQENFLEPDIEIKTFEGEIDPLQLTMLQSGEFLFFRKIWREKNRYVQGFIVPQREVIDMLIGKPFRTSALGERTLLKVRYGKQMLGLFAASDSYRSIGKGSAQLLFGRLSAPLSNINLEFFVSEVAAVPAERAVDSLILALVFVVGLGLWGIYRLGSEHIKLAEERSNFVSAISHELKTPLTSIRMYGEMLCQGWVKDEGRRKSYYDFIFTESERLSRLVNNVLKLAQLNKGQVEVSLQQNSAGQLIESLASKIRAQLYSAEFDLEVVFEPEELKTQRLLIDEDLVSQIVINLVDNALKFSKDTERKLIRFGCRSVDRERLAIFVRDFGPGIPQEKMGKIFQLFYRGEDELKRKTPGTGIGLALVSELARAMNADVRAINRDPGAEFQVLFNCA